MRTKPINRKTRSFLLLMSFLVVSLSLHSCVDRPGQKSKVFHRFYECLDEGVPVVQAEAGPSRNDISIRTLRFRPEHDVFAAIDRFYATRLDWTYLNENDQENIARVNEMGIRMGGASAAGVGQIAPPADVEDVQAFRRSLAIIDLEGNPVIAGWKRTMAHVAWEADPTNPVYFEGHLAFLKGLVDMGCESIQRDEPDMGTLAAARFGGGFSPSGINAFREWMIRNLPAEKIRELGIQDIRSFDYKEYLKERGAPAGDAFRTFECPVKEYWIQFWDEHTKDFWQRMMAEIRQHAGEKNADLQVSCNNTSLQLWSEVIQKFDFGMSELMAGSAWPGHLHNRARVARSHAKHQMFNTPKCNPESDYTDKERTELTRKVIATSYSLGMTCQVPWDKWNHGDTRYFGKPDDYADLFAFIRANDWTGYVEAAAMGPEIEQKSEKLEQLISFNGGNGHVYGFLNLHPENTRKPLLLFLVDWGKPLVERPPVEEMSFLEEGAYGQRLYFSPMGLENLKRTDSQPFEIHLAPQAFPVQAERFVFTLLEPQPYDQTMYKPASKVTDYSVFIKRTELKPNQGDNGDIRLNIPGLSPWGIVQIDLRE